MPTSQTVLFPPPLRAANTIQDLQNWLFSIQNLLPLRLVDTSAGSYSEEVPPAGLNQATGQSNQNQQILYIKTSGDANAFNLLGAINGAQALVNQWDALLIKSNGTNWYAIPLNTSGSAGSAVWGAITGNINSQADLQAEFASTLAAAEAYTDSKIPTFNDNEVPFGAVDGANLLFTLHNAPNPTGSVILVVDDITLSQNTGSGGDYTLGAPAFRGITLNDPPVRQIRAWYRS